MPDAGSRTAASVRTVAIVCAITLAGCTSGQSADPANSSSAPPQTASTTAEDPAITTTTAGAPTSSSRPESTDADGTCDPDMSITGDFDGDGSEDRAMFDASSSKLRVCSSRTYSIAGSGQGEVLLAADLNGDGIDEILTGGTTAWGAGADVVALVGETLDYVKKADGNPLSLWEGLPAEGFLAYGCGDFLDDDTRLVAVVEGRYSPDGTASWGRTLYRIDGHEAVEIAADGGTFDASSAPDPLSTEELEALRGGPCRH